VDGDDYRRNAYEYYLNNVAWHIRSGVFNSGLIKKDNRKKKIH